jgi:hypothetical protein
MIADVYPDLDDRPVLEDDRSEPAPDDLREAWGGTPDDDYREES